MNAIITAVGKLHAEQGKLQPHFVEIWTLFSRHCTEQRFYHLFGSTPIIQPATKYSLALYNESFAID
jgi:hypothetical protein